MDRPRTPAQQYSLLAGAFLLALGVLSLVIAQPGFGTATQTPGHTFLIWNANGWDCIAWLVFGGLGLAMAVKASTARLYSVISGVFFAVVAIWGFINGYYAFNLMSLGIVDNITHAVIGGLGLLVAALPKSLDSMLRMFRSLKTNSMKRFRQHKTFLLCPRL